MTSSDPKKLIITIGITASLLIAMLTTHSFGSARFEGLLSAISTGTDSITLNWNPTREDQNLTGQTSYYIYQATQSGTHNYDHPGHITKDTSYRITGLASNTTYYFVVRAKDNNGQLDSNRVERSAVTFGRWVKKTSATAPSPRLGAGMTYDNKSGKVILFGGRNENGPLNDLWIYNPLKNIWTQQFPKTVLLPSPRTARNIAYVDRRLILVGGLISTTPHMLDHTTWIYNLDTNLWARFQTAADPSGYGFSPNFVYDSANKVVVLFGGRRGTHNGKETVTGETWEFNLAQNAWTQIFPITTPSPRAHHAMVYDSVNRKVIIFGGEANNGRMNDTWTYNAYTNTWTQMFPAVNPSPNSNFEMVYDSHNQQVILFGGILSNKHRDISNETWIYNVAANTWVRINLSETPDPRFLHAMAYDPIGKKVTLFGGGTVLCHDPYCFATTGFVNDTWVYN